MGKLPKWVVVLVSGLPTKEIQTQPRRRSIACGYGRRKGSGSGHAQQRRPFHAFPISCGQTRAIKSLRNALPNIQSSYIKLTLPSVALLDRPNSVCQIPGSGLFDDQEPSSSMRIGFRLFRQIQKHPHKTSSNRVVFKHPETFLGPLVPLTENRGLKRRKLPP